MGKRSRTVVGGDANGKDSDLEPVLPPPPEIEAERFEIDGDEYALISFALPREHAPEGLSPAEQDIVIELLRGKSVRSIAHDRKTSAFTVTNQVRAIYEKLGVHTRAELVKACAPGDPNGTDRRRSS